MNDFPATAVDVKIEVRRTSNTNISVGTAATGYCSSDGDNVLLGYFLTCLEHLTQVCFSDDEDTVGKNMQELVENIIAWTILSKAEDFIRSMGLNGVHETPKPFTRDANTSMPTETPVEIPQEFADFLRKIMDRKPNDADSKPDGG